MENNFYKILTFGKVYAIFKSENEEIYFHKWKMLTIKQRGEKKHG